MIGNYGDGNLGDEAILDIILREFTKLGIEVVVATRNPGALPHGSQIRGVSIVACLRQLHFVDAIVFGGGLFSKFSGPLVYLSQPLAILAKICHKKMVFLNIGYSSSTPFVLKLLSIPSMTMSDFISVRDSTSLANLRRLGIRREVTMSCDLTLKLCEDDFSVSNMNSLLQKEGIARSGLLVGISLTKVHSNKVNQRIRRELCRLIDWLATEKSAQVIFLTFCPVSSGKGYSDKRLGSDIQSGLENERRLKIIQYYPYRTMLALFKRLDLVIGMRLHSLIFGYLTGRPIVGIAYEEKCRSFLEAVGEEGIDASRVTFEWLREQVQRRLIDASCERP